MVANNDILSIKVANNDILSIKVANNDILSIKVANNDILSIKISLELSYSTSHMRSSFLMVVNLVYCLHFIEVIMNTTRRGGVEIAGWTMDRKTWVQYPAYPHRVWALWRQGG